jgi:hypothetical protein
MGPRKVLHLLINEKSQNCKNLATSKARENISTDLESLELYKNDVGLTKFKNDQTILNNISHRFLLTAKLFTG